MEPRQILQVGTPHTSAHIEEGELDAHCWDFLNPPLVEADSQGMDSLQGETTLKAKPPPSPPLSGTVCVCSYALYDKPPSLTLTLSTGQFNLGHLS